VIQVLFTGRKSEKQEKNASSKDSERLKSPIGDRELREERSKI